MKIYVHMVSVGPNSSNFLAQRVNGYRILQEKKLHTTPSVKNMRHFLHFRQLPNLCKSTILPSPLSSSQISLNLNLAVGSTSCLAQHLLAHCSPLQVLTTSLPAPAHRARSLPRHCSPHPGTPPRPGTQVEATIPPTEALLVPFLAALAQALLATRRHCWPRHSSPDSTFSFVN